jgi:hypothetical protein
MRRTRRIYFFIEASGGGRYSMLLAVQRALAARDVVVGASEARGLES